MLTYTLYNSPQTFKIYREAQAYLVSLVFRMKLPLSKVVGLHFTACRMDSCSFPRTFWGSGLLKSPDVVADKV